MHTRACTAVARGYVVNWKLQQQIWDRVFKSVLHVPTRGCNLLLTEPPFTLPALQDAELQV